MGKKLEGNGMWESSRMMLPEHKEAILADNRSLTILIKPELDEQEIQIINETINRSLQTKCMLSLTLYNKFELKTVVGTVLMFVSKLKQIKLMLFNPSAKEDECVWIALREIIKVEIREVEEWDGDDID